MAEKKTITLKNGRPAVVFRSDNDGYACITGHIINKGQYYGVCPDCGTVFCEQCMTDGTFEDHLCDDDEDESW